MGTLRERWQWSDITFSEAPVERLLKSAAELPAYCYRFRHTRYVPDYAAAERRTRQVGRTGLVMCFLPWSPLMRMVVIDAGIENVVAIQADALDEFDETILVQKESLDRACQVAVASPAEVLMITENLSSEVVGRRLFERYLRDSYAEFDRHVREVLEVMRKDRRMVLGVADQVPPDSLERRIRRVGELVEGYGRYA